MGTGLKQLRDFIRDRIKQGFREADGNRAKAAARKTAVIRQAAEGRNDTTDVRCIECTFPNGAVTHVLVWFEGTSETEYETLTRVLETKQCVVCDMQPVVMKPSRVEIYGL